jgi:hypothetical protein
MISVKTECHGCAATGLFSGSYGSVGVAIVCPNCGGTGCVELKYTLFEGRKGRKGIEWVSRQGDGPTGKRISYEEFEQGKMP